MYIKSAEVSRRHIQAIAGLHDEDPRKYSSSEVRAPVFLSFVTQAINVPQSDRCSFSGTIE